MVYRESFVAYTEESILSIISEGVISTKFLSIPGDTHKQKAFRIRIPKAFAKFDGA